MTFKKLLIISFVIALIACIVLIIHPDIYLANKVIAGILAVMALASLFIIWKGE